MPMSNQVLEHLRSNIEEFMEQLLQPRAAPLSFWGIVHRKNLNSKQGDKLKLQHGCYRNILPDVRGESF
jgi:hypothetical protein